MRYYNKCNKNKNCNASLDDNNLEDLDKRQCCKKNKCSMMNDYEDNAIETTSPCSNMYSTHEMNCNCGFDMDDNSSVFPENPSLAQSYVPIQKMKKVFTPEVGLRMGTIFPELVSPYCPGQSIQDIEYLKATNTIGEGCNK